MLSQTFLVHASNTQQGTIEELKYLRQVYKTQLKNETIVDVEEERREVAARLFRGVDGDRSRQGELFGTANLLRFKDGTFMPYGDETRDSHRYGGDVYDVQALVDAAQTASENIVGDGDGVDDLVALAEKGTCGCISQNSRSVTANSSCLDDGEGVNDLVALTEKGTCTRFPNFNQSPCHSQLNLNNRIRSARGQSFPGGNARC